ncbi:unnamed protein product [Paramecium sonneborni]|uniref:Uncharacterized protein n=1 Tax=Paramecium sonneborni TaxID=65129 RepID=A0A8S1RJV9_9CILI|nr:unnamed protein product [Paramecium sonneborni]
MVSVVKLKCTQIKVAVVHKVYQSEMHYQKKLKRLEQYQQISFMPGLIRLLDIQKDEESTLCSNLFRIDVISELITIKFALVLVFIINNSNIN